MELGQAGIPPWGMPWGDRWHSEHRRLPARYVRREFDTAGRQDHSPRHGVRLRTGVL